MSDDTNTSYRALCAQELEAKVKTVSPFSAEEIDAKDKDELEAKLKAYSEQSESLHQAFDDAKSLFNRERIAHEQVFDKLEMVEQATQVTLGREPDRAIEAFEASFQTIDVLTDVAQYSSLGSVGLFAVKIYKWRKAVGAARDMRAAANTAGLLQKPLAPTRLQQGWVNAVAASDDVVKMRRMAVATGALSLVTAGATVYLKHYTNEQMREYYRSAVPAYQNWFEEAREAVLTLCVASKEMRNQLETLKQTLAISSAPENPQASDQALIDQLNESIQHSSEIAAMMTAAERMLCSDMSVLNAAKLSGLPHDPNDAEDPVLTLLSNRRQQLLADNKQLCSTRYPELN